MSKNNQPHREAPVPTGELSRELSLFHITMMSLGMMIGAGVFIGMGICISESGPGGLILTFSLNGLLAIFTAMSFAELSSAIPRAGGVYNFARISFGRGASFIAGWMEWFASSVAGAMYALTFSIYTIRYMKAIGLLGWLLNVFNISDTASVENAEFWFLKIIAAITALAFLYINFRGASETGKIGAIITIGQTIFVVTIGIVGVIVTVKDPTRLENFTPFLPEGWARILATMGFTYVAFEGYEVIAQAGDEAIEPRKNLPKAMLYSVMIVTIIYVLVAFATVVSVKAGSAGVTEEPWKWIGSFREQGFGEAVTRLMPFGNFVLTLAVIFSSTSALNATIYSATRASYALGRDRMMPRLFSKIHSQKKTPYGALIATAVIVLIVATMLPTKDVASSASIMFLFLFFMVNICVIKIRRSMADELTYGFMMPLFPLMPLLAIILQVFLAVWLIHMSMIAWIIAPIWIITGIIIYHAYSKHNAITTEEEILVLEEEKIRESDKYRIMVAVANPDNALQLVDSTYRICGAKDAQVELIHMVPVPDLVSLRDAERYLEPGKEGLVEAMLYLSIHFPLSTTIRYCRNIARGIVSAIRQKKTNMLVLGWHGRPSGRLFNLGSTIDPIIEQSPCNVVVLKDCGSKNFNDTLIPLGGGPNSAFALERASNLTEDTGRITAFFVDTGKYQFDLNKFLDDEAMRLKIPRNRFEGKIVKSKNTTQQVLAESKNYELVVIGNTNKPLWK
ncbi:MAG: amino acid permease, partial [Planctomycetota bacterium]